MLVKSDPFLVLYFSWNLYILYIMYIPITLFVLKLSTNSLMGSKVCKLLGSRQKKIKITISTLFFQRWLWTLWSIFLAGYSSDSLGNFIFTYVNCLFYSLTIIKQLYMYVHLYVILYSIHLYIMNRHFARSIGL